MDRDEELVIEWRCQKLPCQFHHCVDHKEYEKALPLLTPDVDWWSKGIMLMSCDEIPGGLHGALGDGTIRHVFTNSLIDENLAIWRSHNTNFSSRGVKFEELGDQNFLEGPHGLGGKYVKLLRTDEGWNMSRRGVCDVFR